MFEPTGRFPFLVLLVIDCIAGVPLALLVIVRTASSGLALLVIDCSAGLPLALLVIAGSDVDILVVSDAVFPGLCKASASPPADKCVKAPRCSAIALANLNSLVLHRVTQASLSK